MKLTIQDGRDSFYTFDSNRILLLTATDEEQINQVEFSTEEAGGTDTWTKDVLEQEDGVKYVQVPNEFLNGDYTRLVCYAVALDSKGEFTRQKEVFRIKYRPQPEDWFLTYSERVTFASIKALTEQYKATTKQYMETTEGFKNNASDSAELAMKYAENNEDVAVESGKYSAKHWSIKANKKYEEIRQYVGSASDPTSALGSIENARVQAINDVGTNKDNSIAEIDTHVTEVAVPAIDEYVDKTANPEVLRYGKEQVDSYINGTSKPELDRYVNSDKKTVLDQYTENEKKKVLDQYTEEKKGELDSYTNTDKKKVLDDYVNNVKKVELNTYTNDKKSELDVYKTTKADELNEHTVSLKGSLDGYTTAKEQEISEFTEQKKQEVQGVYQSDLNELKSDLDEISEIKQSRNHCDNTRESGYINYSNGKVIPYNTLWHSAYMPITAGKVYTYHNFNSSHYAFYDNEFNFISHSNDNDITTFGGTKDYKRYFIAPDNACYVRLTTQSETDLLQLVEFDSVDDISDFVINESVEYYRYLIPKIREKSIKETMLTDGSVSNSKLLDKSVSKAKVDFVIHDETTNFVKITDFFEDGYIDKNGNATRYISSSQKFYYTDFVEVIPNTTMYSENIYTTYYAFFNENKEFIASYDTLGDLSNGVINVPENANYIRFTVVDKSLSDVWISTKNEKPLPYDYVLDIKTKNTNTPEINNDVNVKVYKKGNLLKLNEVTSGYINSGGTVTPYSTLWCTGYCEVKQGKLYFKGFLLSQYYAFYDENKNVVETYETLTAKQYTSYIYELDVPENAKYFRCTTTSNPATTTDNFFWISNSADMPYEEDENTFADTRPYTLNPENPCDYSELSVGVFNKCACIGDSLTYGGFNLDDGASYGETTSSQALADKYSYPTQFKKITGVEVDNLGTSGATSVSWYEQYKNHDFASYDMAIIHLGVNDSAFSVSDDDTKTALTNIINMLKSSVKNIKIYLCTIVPAYANKEYSGYSHKSELIRTFYAENYENDSDVVLLDMEKYSHARRYTSYTAGHLSALGYYRFAKDLASYISWHIDNNLRDYRFIQFIGNDGVYNGD